MPPRVIGCPASRKTGSKPVSITGSPEKLGADLLVASNQIFYGDWSNDNAPLAGYATVNLHTSYDVSDHFQIYGLIDNLFDAHYGVFGTFFDTASANSAAAAAGYGTDFFTNPRTITPAQPFAAYGGVRVKF
jgi:iron complex outermembrane recepter protein